MYEIGNKEELGEQSQCWVDLALDGSTCYTDRDGLLVKVIVWQDCEVLLESRLLSASKKVPLNGT